METPEQQAAEILIGLGFAEPEELEPEIAELLRQSRERMMKIIYELVEGEVTLDCFYDVSEEE